MERFIQKYNENIIGVLSGWDRLVFRGTLRSLVPICGMMHFLWRMGVLLKGFGDYVERVTRRLRDLSYEAAAHLQRPNLYVSSAQTSKEDLARQIARADRVTEGLICLFRAVEPCMSYEVYRDRQRKELVLVPRQRKCLHIYQYWIHPRLGFLSGRIQTWFPFTVQICLNGREWLARQMDRVGIAYDRRDNSFPWIEDVSRAQRLMDEIFHVSWPRLLREIAGKLNPAHDVIFESYPVEYYWSVHQSEWATDIMFESAKALAAIYSPLVRESIATFGSQDVMRFLGKKSNPNFGGQVVSRYNRRPEGVRIKHGYKANSVKVYDKQGSILRAETTINDPRDFRVFRPKEGEPNGPRSWRRMRKGIADLHRRAQVSQASNERYLDALASIDTDAPLAELISPVCRPRTRRGHRVRGLRPWAKQDRKLLQAIGRGEFAINGFRNRDLVALLYPKSLSAPTERRRASARVTRQLRMLRQHGILRKVPRTFRYVLTAKGRQITTAILQTQDLTLDQIKKAAA